MPKIHFIDYSGAETAVEVEAGESVMQAAVAHMLPGILGDCGGNCTCATCHVYVDPEWFTKLPTIDENEEMMLEWTLERRDNSRLACQIIMEEAYDGLIVRTPESQQ